MPPRRLSGGGKTAMPIRILTFRSLPVPARLCLRLALLACLLMGSALSALAQDVPADEPKPAPDAIQPKAAPVPAAEEVAPPDAPHPGEKGFVPMTPRDRAHLFFKDFVLSPNTYLEGGISAVATFSVGEPEGWPRTTDGMFRRIGSQTALLMMEEGGRQALDAAVGLEPRYFRCRCTGFLPRTGYAIKMTFFTFNEEGHLRPDVPRLAADYGSSMIVTRWYPDRYTPLDQGVRMGHTQVGIDVALNIFREFSPELKRIFHVGGKKAKPPVRSGELGSW
jgi:hypothetical protein